MRASPYVLGVFAGLCGLLVQASSAESVRITEFMAFNKGPLTDEEGEFSDWIELHNGSTQSVNLGGWFLTDNALQLTQWRLPGTNLLPNAYLIVFASGKEIGRAHV